MRYQEMCLIVVLVTTFKIYIYNAKKVNREFEKLLWVLIDVLFTEHWSIKNGIWWRVGGSAVRMYITEKDEDNPLL